MEKFFEKIKKIDKKNKDYSKNTFFKLMLNKLMAQNGKVQTSKIFDILSKE